ncbi:MAG: histidine phosphatase family protein [Anaerovoracaceae bacterium]|jgi:broad specificity phosphatase PhoE/CTP:molybdopterin cytidylyltransferase MocA
MAPADRNRAAEPAVDRNHAAAPVNGDGGGQAGGQDGSNITERKSGDSTAGRYGAVILAAGFSSRMHAFKPLLEIEGKTAAERLIEAAEAAGLAPIYLVTGHERERLEEAVSGHGTVVPVFNPRYAEGMFTSMQAGLAAADPALAGVFLLPVDCPLCGDAALPEMLPRVGDRFAVPVFRGKKGHPLFVPRRHREEILRYHGEGGMKGITDRYFEEMQRIPVDDEAIVLDMDDRAAYAEICRYAREGSGPSLLQLAQGRRFLLLRHGQIRQHRDKIFLGRTDVPLSDRGRRQAAEAGHRLAELQPRTDRIYCSPLQRAAETARLAATAWKETEAKGAQLAAAARKEAERDRSAAGAAIIACDGLQELSLGPWDGRLISEIRERFPDLYALRGRHLMTFKTGHGSENFYDLQYRVVRTLKRLLRDDAFGDIIIVSHKGVLRVIENNLRGQGVEADWQTLNNGQIREVRPINP